MVIEVRSFNRESGAPATDAFRALPYTPRLAANLFAAGVELSTGLLPWEVEYQIAGIEDANLRSTVEGSLIENGLTEEGFEAFFASRDPRAEEVITLNLLPSKLAKPLIPFDPVRETWRGHVTAGPHGYCKQHECVGSEISFPEIVRDAFGPVLANKKDGLWFSPTKSEPVSRKNENVRVIYGACIDVDDGTPAEEVVRHSAAAGVSIVIAPSYSNMKTSTSIPLAKAKELAAEGMSPAEILKVTKNYRQEVVEGASLGEVVKAKDRSGNAVEEQVIHHRPCPKLRALVPFDNPLRESDFESHREFVAAHKRIYRAVAKLIGVENHDRACENPARIFYTARYPEGKPCFNIELPGRFLNPNDPQLLALVPEEEKPNQSSAETRYGSSGDIPESDFNLKRWVACGFGDNFLIIDALEARHPEAFFDQTGGGDWRAIYCPHDSHEQNGGTHVKNADPSAIKSERGFSIHCKHNTCAAEPVSNDRLTHLAKMLELGWLSKADLVAREFFAGPDGDYAQAFARMFPQPLPKGFVRRGDGIFVVRDKDGEPQFDFLSANFSVVGESKNERGEDWSVLIEFASDGRWRRERIPMAELQGNPKNIRERLAGMGLRIDAGNAARSAFDSLLSRLASEKRLLAVSRAGFHHWQGKSIFVAPSGVAMDAEGERADVSLTDSAKIRNAAPHGTFSGWFDSMEAVAKAGNPHWIVGACSGFCGPLINLLDMDSTGIAFIGETSTGKSLGQGMGAAAWGDPDPNKGYGLFRSARTTDNGLESRAALSHGSLLAVDDLAHADPKMISKLVFLLAGGSAKERMNSDGSPRTSKVWATSYTLSSERSISDLIKMGGSNMLGGHAVRLPTINVTGARNVPSDELARVEAFKKNYGHAWQPFIERLFKSGYVAEPERLRARLDGAIAGLCGPDARSTDRRAARPFALLWLGGEIARDAGSLPSIMDIESAVRWAWASYRAGGEAEALSPMDRAINTMRANIQAAWDTDLPRLNSIVYEAFDSDVPDGEEDGRRYRPVKWGWYDDGAIYILRDKLAELAGMTDTTQAIARTLKDRGFLFPNSDRLFHKHLPGRGKVEHFRLRRAEFLGTDTGDE